MKGIAYSFKTRSNGKIKSSSGSKHIKGCLIQILGTTPGERFMNPGFGSQLNKLVFETWSPSLQGLIRYYVKEAINKWEDRIEVLNVHSTSSNNTINVYIKYKIISNKNTDSLTYKINKE